MLEEKSTDQPGEGSAETFRGCEVSASATKGQGFTTVAIGASAGGFDSVLALLKKLPVDLGMSFVVVQHLCPEHQSRLAELFARVTQMTVVEIVDGQPLQANCVHVLPPKFDVTVCGGILKLGPRHYTAGVHSPINEFFASLASDQHDRTIGIVFSGSGADGALGVTAIKEQGGITFAESRQTARFFSMPQNAIATGAVDEVLTPSAIAMRLIHLAQHPLVGSFPQAGEAADSPEKALEMIFGLLRASTGVNFSSYKKSTLLRRIARRMVLARVERLDQYAELLQRSPKELEGIYNDLLINVTGFFRDPEVYKELKRTVLPRLIKAKGSDGDRGELRIWVAGCASGQEAYSIAILVVELLAKLKVNLHVQIFGTDLSEWAIEKTRAGWYPESIANEISAERLRRFFVKKDGGYKICRQIRELCTFARQDLCSDPPFSRLDLLSCRNVLIYFGQSLQRKCVPIFYYALNPRGILVLGNSETIGAYADLFSLIDKKCKIYAKKVVALPPPYMQLTSPRRLAIQSPKPVKSPVVPRDRDSSADIQRAADQLILTHFAPCGVVIDDHMQVWHFRGQTSEFLQHVPGIASLNILKMVCPELAPDLSVAIHRAIKTRSGVRKEGLLLPSGERTLYVSIEVIPFELPGSSEGWLLVVFESQQYLVAPAIGGNIANSEGSAIKNAYVREIDQIRAELASTKESLQSIIEEQDATHEELKSANEEIESSNEELQSANEELETAKEELQSTNEELTTVNDELNSRNLEVNEVNNDLNNLLTSINLAIVMVDNGLTIRRATPLAEKLFNIIPTDVGRRLSDINPKLELPGLIPLIRKVIEELTPVEREVKDHEGHWYSLRVRPYRTRDNMIDGAVITLVDIHHQKQSLELSPTHD